MNVARKAMCFALAVAAATLISLGWQRERANASESVEVHRCPGQRFVVDTVHGGLSPYITLTAGKTTGSFLLDYGATASTLSAEAVPQNAARRIVEVSNFTLPTFPVARFNTTKYWSARAPMGGQLGVVGTDFLSLLTADFSYRPWQKSVVLSEASCPSETLRARGLKPIRQNGFFSSDPSRVSAGLPNVPVVFLDIAGVRVPAQIDTGYDDTERRPSIDINAALYDRLMEQGVRLSEQGSIGVVTCAGAETRRVYKAASVTLFDDRGNSIRELGTASLVQKVSTTCGGIASLSEPAAQIAASLLADLGEIVFDPRNELVWVPAQR